MKRSASLLVLLLFLSFVLPAVSMPLVWAAEDSWDTRAPLPLSCWGVVAVNYKIYAIAGSGDYDNVTYSNNAVLEYDPDLDTWTLKNPMPIKRYSFALAAYQNKIYVIGEPDGLNQLYDPETDTWENRTPMPTPRSQLHANVVNNKIYLIGGMTGGPDSTVGLNEVYDPQTDTWSSAEPIPVPVDSYASAVVDDKIYVIGGSGPKPPDVNQIYDPETNTWSNGAPIPNGVVDAAAGATSGVLAPKKIYVLGGRIDYDTWGTDINQIYNPGNDSWTTGTDMPIARYNLMVAVINDTLYAMGGGPYFNVQGTWTPENYQYIPIGYIPEFPSWTPLLITLVAVVAVIVIYRRSLRKQAQRRSGQ
ncbi:MAG: hypothetical protein QCH99_06690 [Candidatus Bathyarchaeota archaeon]|nr:hypothetical protein [Candidatus Bathyarchaeum tardum]